MNGRHIWALGFVSLLAAYGCTASSDSAETPNEASQDELGLRTGNVDHAAIVEVTTMMLVGDVTDFGTVLDPYNQDDPFKIRSTSYADAFTRNLSKFDAYDGVVDWKPEQVTPWVSRISSANYLVVDASKPCDFYDPHTYLEIERAQLTGKQHETCGGRMPNEDALDVTLAWLIKGPSASATAEDAINDGVSHPTKDATDEFPYLAEMNGI